MAQTRGERPIPIRVMLVTNDPELADSIRLHLVQAFPIEIARVVDSAQQARSLMRGVYPDVVLIAEGTPRSSLDMPALSLSREINLTYPGIATIILAHEPTPEYLLSAFDAGARGVVAINPSEQGWFILGEDLEPRIRQAYEFVTRQFPHRLRGVDGGDLGRIVTVFSPKGGVGKSLVATALAAHLAAKDLARRVVLVDLNLQFGSVDVLLDIKPQHTLGDVAQVATDATRHSLEGLLHDKELPGGARLHILPAPTDPIEADRVSADQVGNVLTSLRNQFNFTIVDTTSVISDVTLTALQMASDILLVCTPDLLSIHQTRAGIDFLRRPDAHITGAISLVINRSSSDLDVRAEDLKNLFEYPTLAVIPADYAYLEPVLNAGQIAGLAPGTRRNHPVALAINALAEAVARPPSAAAQPDSVKKPKRNLFSRRTKS